MDREGYSTSIRFGECVVVTPRGAERLGTRTRDLDAYVVRRHRSA